MPSRIDPEWYKRGLCRGKGPWPWITPEDATQAEFELALTAAREICSQCPVQRECRVAGLTEIRGTYAGISYRERGVND